MANSAIQLSNLTLDPLSVDIKINEDDAIRAFLAPRGDPDGKDVTDVSEVATLGELNKNPELQRLLEAGVLSVGMGVPGDSDVPGSESDLAIPNAEGFSGSVLTKTVSPGSGTDTLLVAAMPFAAEVVDSQLLVLTAEATTWDLNTEAAAAGTALSQSYSTAVAPLRIRDDGTAGSAVLAAGDPIYLVKGADATAVATVTITFNRLS